MLPLGSHWSPRHATRCPHVLVHISAFLPPSYPPPDWELGLTAFTVITHLHLKIVSSNQSALNTIDFRVEKSYCMYTSYVKLALIMFMRFVHTVEWSSFISIAVSVSFLS